MHLNLIGIDLPFALQKYVPDEYFTFVKTYFDEKMTTASQDILIDEPLPSDEPTISIEPTASN